MIEIRNRLPEVLRATALAVGLCCGPVGTSVALAASPTMSSETTIKGWLGEWRDFGTAISTGSIDYDPKTDTVHIQNLVIGPSSRPSEGWTGSISVAQLDVRGASGSSGAIATESLRLQGVTAEIAGTTLRIASLDVLGAKLPLAALPAGSTARPTPSLARLDGDIERFECVRIEGDAIEVGPSRGDAPSGLSIAHLVTSDFKNGTFDRIELTDLVRGRSDKGGDVKIGRFGVEHLAMSALLSMFDAKSYVAASPPRPWKVFAEAVTVKTLSTTAPGSRLVLAEARAAGVRVRPLPFDPMPLLSATSADPNYLASRPDDLVRFFDGLFDSVALDRFELHDVTIDDGAATPIRRAHVDDLDVAGVDAHRIGRAAIQGLRTQDGEAGLGISRLAITDLVFPQRPTSAPPSAGRAEARPPSLASASLDGLTFVAPGLTADIRAAHLEAADYVGALPTRFAFSLEGLSAPVSTLADPNLKTVLADLELTRFAADLDLAAEWDGVRDQLTFEHADLTVADLGKLTLSATFGGISRSFFERPETLRDQLPAASLVQARLFFVDAGLTERALKRIAVANKQTPDQIRKALTANMPSLLGAISDATVRNRLIFAAISFLNAPKTLEIKSVPQTPIAVSDIDRTVREKPAALPGLLKLEASSGDRR